MSSLLTFGILQQASQPQGDSIDYVTSGLISHLDAGNSASYPGSGTTWFNLVNSTYDATLANGPSFNNTSPKYFNFNGAGQYAMQTGFPFNGFKSAYTVEIWFKLPSLPTNYIDTPDQDSINATPLYGYQYGSDYQLFVYPSGGTTSSNLGVCYDDSRGNANHRSAASIGTNQWVQFVQIGNNTQFGYYVNGALDTALKTSSDTGYNMNSNWTIAFDARYFVFGIVDVSIVRIYNRILTSTEVAYNFNGAKNVFGL